MSSDEDPGPGGGAAGAPESAGRFGGSATTWIAVGSLLNGLGAFGFQVVGTRTLGAVAYAPVAVLWTLQYLWVAVAVTALEAYVTRMVTVHGRDSAEVARFTRLVAPWLIGTALVTAIAAVAVSDLLFEGLAALGGVLGLVVLGYGWYGMIRGEAAGQGRFRRYGLATIGESGIRLLAAVVVLAAVPSTTALAMVLPLGPLIVGVVAWVRRDRSAATLRPDTHEVAPGTGRRFLASASTANTVVQFLLAGGPLVLLPLGADAVSVSIYVTTITAARVPMTFALNGGLSRLLPPLVRLWQDGDGLGLRRAAARIVAAIAAVALVAAAGAAVLGPEVMALVFGEEFRPDRTFMVVVAIGTVLAVGGLLLDQVFIATEREGSLPAIWAGSAVLAAVLVAVLPGAPTLRVAVAFALATGVAVAALSTPLLRRS